MTPNLRPTLAESAAPSSGVMLLLLAPKGSQADSTTEACEETTRCDLLSFKTPLQVVFSFHVGATLRREAQMSVENFRYPEGLQNKPCTCLTVSRTLPSFITDSFRISMFTLTFRDICMFLNVFISCTC